MSNEASDDSRSLLLKILKDTTQEAQIAELRGEDAQCVADLLSVVRFELVRSHANQLVLMKAATSAPS
jgi:hypothetical protein